MTVCAVRVFQQHQPHGVLAGAHLVDFGGEGGEDGLLVGFVAGVNLALPFAAPFFLEAGQHRAVHGAQAACAAGGEAAGARFLSMNISRRSL